uniref:Acidic leucine-rich nuclear phosphoprotein 32-related protein n=1 Tax=Noccaea caerulescens TaxID=107243 RepID=A0A1J3DGP4_NOCCA
MDEIWERAVETALVGETDPLAARVLTLDGSVKCVQGHLPRPELLERYQNLEHLSIASIGVSSLDRFPRLGKLRKLVLSDNRIAGGLEFLVQAGLGLLRDLDLSNNRIHLIEDLVPLAQLKLVSLDLYECPVTRIKDYRSKVFGLVKSLKYLDKMDVEENERPESEDEDEDDDEEEDDDEDEDDPGSCEIDGEERPNVMSNGNCEKLEGVLESEADEEETETETGRQSNGVSEHANGLRDEHLNMDDEENLDSEGEEKYEDDGFLVDATLDIDEEDEGEGEGAEEVDEGEEDEGEGAEEVDNDEGNLRVQPRNWLQRVRNGEIDGPEEVAEAGRESNWMSDVVANGFQNVDDEENDDSEEVEYEDDGFLVVDNQDMDEEDDEDEDDVDNDEVGVGVPHRNGLLRNILTGEIDGHEQGEDDGESGEEEEQGVEDGEDKDEDDYEVGHLAQPVAEAIEVDEDTESEEEYEDDDVQVVYSVASSSHLKRKRDEDDDGDSVSNSSDNNDDDDVSSAGDDDDDDDDDDDGEKEIVWQDDNYIRPIKDLTTAEWEEAVFKDISPLMVFVHNRYKRPKENEKFREEIEKAVQVIWNCGLPSPRCVAVDAVVETDLVSALKVSVFPEIIFTKAGKILYREKGIRTADELSKIMAFFYYGAAKPPCLNGIDSSQEQIPSVDVSVD